MRPPLAWGLAAAVAAVCAGAWLAVPPGDDPVPGPEGAAGPPGAPVAVLSGAEVAAWEAGRLRARITADRAEWTPDGRRATLRGRPRLALAVEVGGAPRLLEVEARRITIDPPTRAVRFDGGLRVTAEADGVVAAQSATWDPQAQVFDLTRAQVDADDVGRLRADRIRYDARTRVLHAFGHVVLGVRGLEIRADRLRYEQETRIAHAEGAVRAAGRGRELTAPVLRYDGRRQVAEATGGVRLTHGDLVVRAPVLRFLLREDVTEAEGTVDAVQGTLRLSAGWLRHDGRTGEVVAEGPVALQWPGTRAGGRRLAASLTAQRAEITGGATLVRTVPGADGEEATVTAGRLVVRWGANEVEAHEEVVVRQRGRTAWADRLDYSGSRDRLVLTGRVAVEQRAGAPPADPPASDRIAAGGAPAPSAVPPAGVTRLYGVALVAALQSGDLDVAGPVTIVQRDRRATGHRATYADATRVLVLTGQVRVEETDGRRLRADRVVVSLADETLEAEGGVETEFVIRPGPAGRP